VGMPLAYCGLPQTTWLLPSANSWLWQARG